MRILFTSSHPIPTRIKCLDLSKIDVQSGVALKMLDCTFFFNLLYFLAKYYVTFIQPYQSSVLFVGCVQPFCGARKGFRRLCVTSP